MNRRWLALASLLMLWSLVAGCAAPGASYQGPAYGETYYSDVPPSFYDNDPMLRQWYTAPYWMPDVDH